MTAALATHQQQQQPTARTYESEMNHPQPAKNVFVYLNGDRHFAGRKFVVNRRYISNFEGFLNEVTRGMKAPFGAIRNIYTPSAGHRIDELDKIENNMDLVAGGLERFRKLSYKEIQEANKRRRHQPKVELIYRHRNNKMTNVSARWMKYVKEPCQIYVYANGDILAPAVKLLLIPRTMKDWDLVLQEVTEKVPMRSGGAVRKVYDLNYRPIRDPTELENGAYYIACGNERLKKCPYGELPAKGHHQISPRRANAPLPPIKTAFKSKSKEDGDSYTKMYAHRKQLKDETTTVMGASAATGYRAIKIKKDRPPAAATAAGGSQPASESVFHAKPVKVKPRSRPAPPSTSEEDDLFHSHAPQLAADEVEDSEDTKIDRPIDQIPVEEVHEEEIHAAADTGGGGDDEEATAPAPATGPADDSRPATPEEKIEEVTVVAESEPTAAPTESDELLDDQGAVEAAPVEEPLPLLRAPSPPKTPRQLSPSPPASPPKTPLASPPKSPAASPVASPVTSPPRSPVRASSPPKSPVASVVDEPAAAEGAGLPISALGDDEGMLVVEESEDDITEPVPDSVADSAPISDSAPIATLDSDEPDAIAEAIALVMGGAADTDDDVAVEAAPVSEQPAPQPIAEAKPADDDAVLAEAEVVARSESPAPPASEPEEAPLVRTTPSSPARSIPGEIAVDVTAPIDDDVITAETVDDKSAFAADGDDDAAPAPTAAATIEPAAQEDDLPARVGPVGDTSPPPLAEEPRAVSTPPPADDDDAVEPAARRGSVGEATSDDEVETPRKPAIGNGVTPNRSTEIET